MDVKIHNFQSLLDTISSAACIIDHNQKIVQSNKNFTGFMGSSTASESDVAIAIDQIIPDIGNNVYRWKKILQGNGTSTDKALYIQDLQHNTKEVSVVIVPFHNDSGFIHEHLVILNTHLPEFEREDIRQEQQVSSFSDSRHNLHSDELSIVVEKQRHQLLEINKALQRVKREINNELEMAKNVQTSLMPKELPEFLNVKISSIYIPAGKVGGDFYDIILTPSQKLAILIFDVSGHGVPAALIGAMAKMLFAHYIEQYDSPAKIFAQVNAKLCQYIRTEHYLTAFLGILDPIQNSMIYSRAGHVRPIVYHSKTKEISTLDSRGFFIGHTALVDIAEYFEESVIFEPDDRILFYTDGLTEGSNPANELYGTDKVVDTLRAFGTLPLKKMLNEIREDQKRFRDGMPLRDDFTMLCVQVGDAASILSESGFLKEDTPHILVISKTQEIQKTCAQILKALDSTGFSDREIKHIRICLYEMMMNAIVHGNRNDSSKSVLVIYRVYKDRIAVSIVDEGKGYDWHRVPSPLEPENLFKESGRGIFIIKQYMDEVQFNKKGNRILVVKYHKEED